MVDNLPSSDAQISKTLETSQALGSQGGGSTPSRPNSGSWNPKDYACWIILVLLIGIILLLFQIHQAVEKPSARTGSVSMQIIGLEQTVDTTTPIALTLYPNLHLLMTHLLESTTGSSSYSAKSLPVNDKGDMRDEFTKNSDVTATSEPDTESETFQYDEEEKRSLSQLTPELNKVIQLTTNIPKLIQDWKSLDQLLKDAPSIPPTDSDDATESISNFLNTNLWPIRNQIFAVGENLVSQSLSADGLLGWHDSDAYMVSFMKKRAEDFRLNMTALDDGLISDITYETKAGSQTETSKKTKDDAEEKSQENLFDKYKLAMEELQSFSSYFQGRLEYDRETMAKLISNAQPELAKLQTAYRSYRIIIRISNTTSKILRLNPQSVLLIAHILEVPARFSGTDSILIPSGSTDFILTTQGNYCIPDANTVDRDWSISSEDCQIIASSVSDDYYASSIVKFSNAINGDTIGKIHAFISNNKLTAQGNSNAYPK